MSTICKKTNLGPCLGVKHHQKCARTRNPNAGRIHTKSHTCEVNLRTGWMNICMYMLDILLVETYISLMTIYLIRMVRSVET